MKGLSDQIAVWKNQVDQNLTTQAVMNATTTATIQCMQGNIAQLMSMTKVIIPNANVMPGWGDVTITPSGSATVKGAVSSGT